MPENNDPPVTPPVNITEPPKVPATPADPPVTTPVVNDDVTARMTAIEESVGTVAGAVETIASKLEAIVNPTTTPTDPPADPSTDPEVLKLQGELNLLKTAFEQETAAKLAESNTRKTEMVESIMANNPAYAAQKDTLVLMDEPFLAMLAEQSKAPEPRVRVAGGDKYDAENFQTQAARLREDRRKRSIR